jgi:hypothetical protein
VGRILSAICINEVFDSQRVERKAYMLINEKDGDVLTLSVLAERSLDALNFRLWEYVYF